FQAHLLLLGRDYQRNKALASAFLVRLPNSEPLLLTIDAAYTLDHWDEKALPGFLASTVDTVRSVQKLSTIVERTGENVVTGHDPDAWSTFKKAP
ncbi:hypothetical protein ACC697_38250, partial [Rhizobium ruizarguesonis]